MRVKLVNAALEFGILRVRNMLSIERNGTVCGIDAYEYEPNNEFGLNFNLHFGLYWVSALNGLHLTLMSYSCNRR